MPWQQLSHLIESHNPQCGKKGERAPDPLATMLRIPLLLQWSSLIAHSNAVDPA